MLASALTLGTGGSGGREGTDCPDRRRFWLVSRASAASDVAQRRVIMAAGMGAGIAAIFRAPLAGALFAAEVLYYSPDFESEVIIPAGLASVAAYCTFGLAFGWDPLFVLPRRVPSAIAYLQQSVATNRLHGAGAAHGGAGHDLHPHVLRTDAFFFIICRSRPTFRPMVGATLTGLLGIALYYAAGRNQDALAVLSFGYAALQRVLVSGPDASLSFAAILATVALGKIGTTGLTIGSGGSGGVFGPSMVIGGCAVGAFGENVCPSPVARHGALPGDVRRHGVAGFFAAAAKTPFSTLVIVSKKMTGGYGLLLPALWVCTLTFLLSGTQSFTSRSSAVRRYHPPIAAIMSALS